MSKSTSELEQAYLNCLDQGESHRDHFDWPSAIEVLDKVIEEAYELKEAIVSQNETETFNEASDLVFTVVQCLRHLKIDLKDCLNYSNKKFQIRFNTMAKLASENNLDLKELEELWGKAKVLSKNEVKKLNTKT